MTGTWVLKEISSFFLIWFGKENSVKNPLISAAMAAINCISLGAGGIEIPKLTPRASRIFTGVFPSLIEKKKKKKF